MRVLGVAAPDSNIAYSQHLESYIQAYADDFFSHRPIGVTPFEIGTTYRGDYVEVMVFVAGLSGDAELGSRVRTWAKELERELESIGYATVVYVQSYTPSVQRV